MGNVHNKRDKKLCNPIKVESVTPQKITTEIGIYSQKVGEEMKTYSVGMNDMGSTFAMLLVFFGGGYLLLGLVKMFTKRREPWLSDRQLTGVHYEESEMSPLVKKVSMKSETRKCIPMSVNI